MKSVRWQEDETLKEADPAVLQLLERGAPENGVDFAPWWESQLATLKAEGLPPAPAKRVFGGASRRSAALWAYACVLIVGGLLGGATHAVLAGAKAAPSPLANCQYQPAERQAMFAVLDAPAERRAEVWQANAATLTACGACHVNLKPARSAWSQR
ncbi:MAG TPA: hypothetical protein VNC50_02690 [Planctomycetia bacterium]|nr:hypothetical protein [Planctomycetia bacterium]